MTMNNERNSHLVIPGRREAASPESITTTWDYGFRLSLTLFARPE
jgi:hypothetical protein